jgi:hypothetical protein
LYRVEIQQECKFSQQYQELKKEVIENDEANEENPDEEHEK